MKHDLQQIYSNFHWYRFYCVCLPESMNQTIQQCCLCRTIIICLTPVHNLWAVQMHKQKSCSFSCLPLSLAVMMCLRIAGPPPPPPPTGINGAPSYHDPSGSFCTAYIQTTADHCVPHNSTAMYTYIAALASKRRRD